MPYPTPSFLPRTVHVLITALVICCAEPRLVAGDTQTVMPEITVTSHVQEHLIRYRDRLGRVTKTYDDVNGYTETHWDFIRVGKPGSQVFRWIPKPGVVDYSQFPIPLAGQNWFRTEPLFTVSGYCETVLAIHNPSPKTKLFAVDFIGSRLTTKGYLALLPVAVVPDSPITGLFGLDGPTVVKERKIFLLPGNGTRLYTVSTTDQVLWERFEVVPSAAN